MHQSVAIRRKGLGDIIVPFSWSASILVRHNEASGRHTVFEETTNTTVIFIISKIPYAINSSPESILSSRIDQGGHVGRGKAIGLPHRHIYSKYSLNIIIKMVKKGSQLTFS